MSRVQVALNVSDLNASVEFYSKFFGAEPAKVRPGYANFAIEEPALKLVLIEDGQDRGRGVAGALNHLGVEVETPEKVRGGHGQPGLVGARARGSRADHLLLRRSEQAVGRRPGRRPMGGVHRLGRCAGRDRPWVFHRRLFL